MKMIFIRICSAGHSRHLLCNPVLMTSCLLKIFTKSILDIVKMMLDCNEQESGFNGEAMAF